MDATPRAVSDLIEALRLEPVAHGADQAERRQAHRYVGKPADPVGLPVTYGGHVLGQAVAAAQATVDPERRLHSLHAYFLRGGRHDQRFHYDVETVRDGRSYTSRRVRGWQDQDRPCFELSASFAVEESGPTAPLSDPPEALRLDPEGLVTYRELMDQLNELGQIPSPVDWSLRDNPIDIRPVHAKWHPDGLGPGGSINQWIRSAAPLPADPALHVAILAFQSDESLADTLFAPFDLEWGDDNNSVSSLDHSLWIHRPVDLNQWLYIEQFPETISRGRGLARARMWNQSGELVASAAQEVLIRLQD